MEVCLNNEKITTEATTLAELVAEKLPGAKGIAVAVGSTVIPRSQWTETHLSEQTVITVISATRGG